MRAQMLLAAGLATLAAAAPAPAATLTVTGTADGVGSCMAGTCTTLRAAIEQADTLLGADTIVLPAGSYGVFAGGLVLTSDVTIAGASARTTSVTPTSGRTFFVAAGVTATLSHVTVAGGAATAGNGGVLFSDGTLTLDHVRLSSGNAANGGAVFNSGTLTIRNSLIDHNAATTGGAIASTGPAVTISDSTIAINTSTAAGGAVFLPASGSVALSRTTLSRNTGGAALDPRGTATASASTSIVADNTPNNCGAIKPADLGGNLADGTSCGFTAATSRQGVASGLPSALSNAGGETDVLALPSQSAAVDLGAPCPDALDQRDLDRGQGPGCDAGAYELDQPPDTVFTAGPIGAVPRNSVFRFTSPEPATFQCRADDPGVPGDFAACPPQFLVNALSGTHTFYVRAVDATGKLDPTPATSTFTIRPGAPQVTLDGPSGAIRDASPTFTFSGSDFDATFECSLDSGFAPCTSPLTAEDLPDGPHLFVVRATVAGDRLADIGRSFTVDTGDPETTIDTGVSGATSNNDPSFAFSANEPSTFRCRLNGPGGTAGTFAQCTSPRGFTDLADGVYSFSVAADDAVGNHDATPARRDFSVDTVAPSAPQMRLPFDGTLQNTTSVLVSVVSELGMTVHVFDNGLIRGDAVFSSPVWELTVTNLLDGTHFFATRAFDAAGNFSPLSESRAVRIDTVAPPAPVITAPAEGAIVHSSTVTLSGTAEPDSTVGLTGGGTTTATGGAWTFELTNVPDGPHTYSVKATDAAGNTGPAATRTITVDTAPVVTTPTATPTPEATPVTLPAPTPAPTTAPASQAPTVLVARVSGRARLKPRGGTFAPLVKSQAVAYGATVDATRGTVRISPNAKQSATAKGAVFTVTQASGVTVLRTTSCRGTFTVDTRTGGFTTRSGKMTISARRSAKWAISKKCRKLTVLRGTVSAP